MNPNQDAQKFTAQNQQQAGSHLQPNFDYQMQPLADQRHTLQKSEFLGSKLGASGKDNIGASKLGNPLSFSSVAANQKQPEINATTGSNIHIQSHAANNGIPQMASQIDKSDFSTKSKKNKIFDSDLTRSQPGNQMHMAQKGDEFHPNIPNFQLHGQNEDDLSY